MTTSPDAARPASRTPAVRLAVLRERWSRVVRPPRVAGVDVARALAVVGMIAAHVGNAPDLVLSDPSTWAGVVHGRSSLLFALVAGVSVALMTRGVRDAPVDEVRRVRLTLVGRGVVVLALGVLLELVGSPVAIILGLYGILFILVAPIVGWTTRRLLATVGVLVVVAALVALAKVVGLPGGDAAQLALLGTYPLPVWLALALTGLVVGRGDLGSLRRAGALVGVGALLCVVGYGGATLLMPASDDASAEEPASPGSSLTEVPGGDVDLTGSTCLRFEDGTLTCWRSDLTVDGRAVDGGAVDGGAGSDGTSASGASRDAEQPGSSVGSGAVDASFGWDGTPRWWRSPVTLDGVEPGALVGALVSMQPHSGGLGEVVGSGGLVLAVLGLCLAVGRLRVLRTLLVPLAALGSMPLTVYSLHVLSFLVPRFVEPVGPTTWLWQVGVLTAFATVRALTRGKGPLEQLTARLAARYAVRPPVPHRPGTSRP